MSFIVVGGAIAAAGSLTKLGMSLSGRKKRIEEQKQAKAQTLESGITLTYANSGQIATITGNIEIIKAGTSNQTIYFDVEKLLSMA